MYLRLTHKTLEYMVVRKLTRCLPHAFYIKYIHANKKAISSMFHIRPFCNYIPDRSSLTNSNLPFRRHSFNNCTYADLQSPMPVERTHRLYQFWNSKKVIVPNRIHCVISLSHRVHVIHISDVHIASVRIILCHYGGLMMSIYGKVKHLSPSTKLFVRYRRRRQHIAARIWRYC